MKRVIGRQYGNAQFSESKEKVNNFYLKNPGFRIENISVLLKTQNFTPK